MPRRRYIFDPPERFVAGTVGEPGERAFFLQARDGRSRRQRRAREGPGRGPRRAARRAPRRARRRGIAPEDPADRGRRRTTQPLDEPLNEAFRAGSLTLGWDGDAERILVEARAEDEDGEPIDPDEDDDEDEDGPDLLRVRMTAGGRAIFVERAARVVAVGPSAVPAVRPAARPARATSARAATATTSTDRPARCSTARLTLRRPARGRDRDRRPHRRLVATTRCSSRCSALPGSRAARAVVDAVYKPTLGERPLDDFPDGTLSRREVAAWHVSEAIGWGIVPPTVLRDGPFGEGMVQAYVELDLTVDVVAMVVDGRPAPAADGGVRCGR